MPLDKETISGSLQMHWQDLPQFAEALSELGLRQGAMELEPREALKFINACGRALQCYRALGQADSKEQLKKLLNWATKRGSDQNPSMLTTRTHSLDCQNLEFTTLPWLVDNAISEKQSAFKQGVGPDVAKQLEIFKRQLQSIEYSEKGYLPSYSEVKSAFERIAKAGPTQVIESRRAIIAEWVAKGCAIKYQDAPFRKLESKERDDAYEFLDHHIKPNFKLQNQALCRRLIEEHLTVKADAGASAKAQIEKLLTLLVHLDNKSHYNELGQILGMLISKTKTSTGQNRVYSAPQLTTWLEALLDNSTYETQHYPVNLLNEILTSHIDNKNSSLLNIDLFRLKDRTESIERLHLIQENARLDLPNPYKPILVKLSLQSQDKHDVAFIGTAQGLLMDMHRAEAHPDWMKATTTLLTYLNNLVFRDKESVTGLAPFI